MKKKPLLWYNLKKAIETENTEDIKAKTEALKQASYKIAEEVYKQQSAQDPNAADASANNGADSSTSNSGFNKGSAEDVDYEVHDDEK